MNSKNNSEEISETILIVLLLLSILPFIIFTFFNHPAGVEDYFFWDRMEKVGFVKAIVSLYNNWSGRFFTHAELLVAPFIYKTNDGYKLFTLFLMLLLFLSLYLFISVLFKNIIDIKERILFSLAIIFMYFFGMNTVSQGFYWLISTIVYHNTLILILYFFIFYIMLCKANTSFKKIFYTVILCFTAAAISGSNEIALVFIFMMVSFFLITELIIKKKINRQLISVFVVILISGYIDLHSHGTQLREDKFAGTLDFSGSVYLSFIVLIENLLNWVFISPLLILTVFLVPVFLKIIKHKNEYYDIFILNPFFSIALGFILLITGIFLSVWGIGHYPYDRTLNFIYFLFLIIWFYNVIVIIYYLNKKYNFKNLVFSNYVYAILITITISFIFMNKNFITAYSDLFSGTAYKFNKEMNERYKYIEESKSDTLVLNSLENFPKTIYPFDITNDPDIIYNQWYAHHFNKKSVIVKNPVNNP